MSDTIVPINRANACNASITIDGKSVYKDERGYFRLNDLQAAGGHAETAGKSPRNWIRLEATRNYISALDSMNALEPQKAYLLSGEKSATCVIWYPSWKRSVRRASRY